MSEGTNVDPPVDPPVNNDEPKTLADLVKSNPELQTELNNMMASNRRKTTEENQKLVQELESLKRNHHLTQEERDGLSTRINQLEEQYLTKEELAKREANKQQKDFESQVSKATEQTQFWKNLYSTETIDRSIQDAAINNDAERPWQIVDMLRQKTQLVEVLDESGNPTGMYSPIIKFNDTNDDGDSVTLDLSPDAVLKRMKELPDKYGNLFKGVSVSGLGENNKSGSKTKASLEKIMSSQEEYAKWRKENPNLDLSDLTR